MSAIPAVAASVPAEGIPTTTPALFGVERAILALRALIDALGSTPLPAAAAALVREGTDALAAMDASLAWSGADVITAYDEGWIVAVEPGEGGQRYVIRRHPSNVYSMFPEFHHARAAAAHVLARALRGSRPHRPAGALGRAGPRRASGT